MIVYEFCRYDNAEKALDLMKSEIKAKTFITHEEANRYCNCLTELGDRHYGWNNLDEARISMKEGGFSDLIMPGYNWIDYSAYDSTLAEIDPLKTGWDHPQKIVDTNSAKFGTSKKMISDPVNHPSHYQSKSGLEVIDVIEAFTDDLIGMEAVCTANAIKYILRWKKKGGIEDVKKAVWYLEKLIKGKEVHNDWAAVYMHSDKIEEELKKTISKIIEDGLPQKEEEVKNAEEVNNNDD